MKKQIIYIALLFIASIFYGCKKDNYEAPNASISGNIVDAATGKNVPQQTLNGAKIRLYQLGYNSLIPQPISSSVKADGSYANNFIFNGKYKLFADGPFFLTDTVFNLSINGNTKQDLKVQPYLTLSCEVVSKTATSVTIKVNAKRSVGNTQKIARVGAAVGLTVAVDINNYYNVNASNNGRPLINTETDSDAAIEAKSYEFVIDKLKPNTLYYVRGAARTINNGSLFNYTDLIEVTTAAQ
jgi:PBP1b-binding outer membrane lipoprotein LpoB